MKIFLTLICLLLLASCSFESNSAENDSNFTEKTDSGVQVQPDGNSDSFDTEIISDDDIDEQETDDDTVLPDEDLPDNAPISDEDIAEITVTIGTYNLDNMFDSVCDSGTDNSGDCKDMMVLSASEFTTKVNAVAESIREIDSDIQIMVEIEDKTSSDAIFSKLSDIYNTVYIAVKYTGSQNLGILTKGEITKVVKHGNETDESGYTFTREFPEIHISYLGKEIIVFPAHFKAKSSDDPEKRLWEATKAAEIINEVAAKYPNALIVMGGDLNDEPGSDPLNALDSANLLRTASDLSTNDQCTYNYDGCESIDHIYLSLSGSGDYISKSAKVIKDGGCGYGDYCLGSSDHAAIRADFKF